MSRSTNAVSAVVLSAAVLIAGTMPSAGASGLVSGAAGRTTKVGTAGPAHFTVAKGSTVSLAGLGSSASVAIGPRELTPPKRRGKNPLRSAPGEAGPALGEGSGTATTPGQKTKAKPKLVTSWEGVNHRDSRLAANGNQFSGEPPDQGLCAGNGFVLETVNSAIRVFDTAGSPRSNVISLNEFYGFAPAIDRVNGGFGPFTFDISCHFDPDSQRWFHLAVHLEQDPVTGDFTGGNYLDLAVSSTNDPTGAWNIYLIPGMNDGTLGTPNHGCTIGGAIPGPCFADFPHIGVDKNGVYISTNEFELFGDAFIGAQIYALSKAQLTAGDPNLAITLFNTADDPVRPGEPGFTVWPVLSAGTQFESAHNGTEYFVSSNAVFDDLNGDSSELIVWALSNTESLTSATPELSLDSQIVPTQRYAVPPPSEQKAGTLPLGELLVGPDVTPGLIDTSDSRVLDVRYANGKLWTVLGTAARAGSSTVDRAGVAWFVMKPGLDDDKPTQVVRQGILGLPDEALIFPTIGITTKGKGVIGFSRVGPNLFPSVGSASLDAVAGAGPVAMITEGQSPQDGFTEYGGRPRFGDYAAAAVDGSTVFLANEYIQQAPCSADDLLATGCSGTRTLFANWTTRVAKFKL